MTRRLSLILGDADQEQLAPFIRPGTEHHQVLQRWAATHGGDTVNSEAAALRTLLQAGADALRDDVLDAGYADLAGTYNTGSADADRRSARDRYVARIEPAH